ncbi:MAG TPA: prepilin-type N-terminal cleavage/methylation domain-containing protein [Gemmatimonadaceae bacterium]|nr:prepilin-type N-terminal cleavage/methylation domain-containing protein [Gemmatimonadaceae bacterium]
MKSNRKGFTLIELLIVVVIIGILAAIAIPKFANTKEKAYVAAMKSDLRNLMTAEEGYFADFQAFGSVAAVNFTPSNGVTVTATPAPPPAAGYTANASHNQTARTCSVVVGDGTVNDGVIQCT